MAEGKISYRFIRSIWYIAVTDESRRGSGGRQAIINSILESNQDTSFWTDSWINTEKIEIETNGERENEGRTVDLVCRWWSSVE